MKLLTPEEVLQALKDAKSLEWTYEDADEWYEFIPKDFPVESLLHIYYSFRLAQETINPESVSFPKPITEEPPEETTYYYPSIECNDLFNTDVWRSLPMDYRLLQRGLIHLDVRDAIAHSKALIKLSGGTYE